MGALIAILAACGPSGVASTFAAPPPPGIAPSTALQRSQTGAEQLNQETQLPKQQGDVVVTSPLNRAELPKPGGPKVLLKTVVFEPPSAFLTAAELNAITAQFIGKRLDFSEISRLVRDVNDLYAKKGIVTASAILPPQNLGDGNLKVQLVEGKLGKVAIVGNRRDDSNFILHSVKLARGDYVDVPMASADIEFFNKSNEAQLRLLLQPGAAFGLTDLSLGVTEPPANTLQFFVDNEGVESTGELEFGTYFRAYAPLHRDDSFTVYATDSGGSVAGTVSYNVPVSTFGTRVGASYTRSGIAVVSGPTAVLDITGNSQAAAVTLSQQLIGTADWSLLALLSGSYGTSASYSTDVPLVDSITKKGVLGFALGYSHDGVSFNVQPQLIYANAEDLLSDNVRDLLLTAGTVNGSIRLSKDTALFANAAWQYTDAKLLPGDLLFQIGGPNTVRGYPSDGVAGDRGYFAQVELHHDLSRVLNGLDVFAFTDAGQVFSTFPAVTTLVSAGAGINWTAAPGTTASLTAAVPLLQAFRDQFDFAVYAGVHTQAF